MNNKSEFADGYYDGIPEYILKMNPEQLEKFIEDETRKCEELNKSKK